MADVKDGDIVFEYPDDDEIPGSNIPEEKEKNEVKVETKADDIDLEITEDDIPVADRGKEPLPKEKVEELENDTLEDYSERVKQRMAQLKKVWHDERRAKESADRERHEAIKFAQQISEENKRLKTTLTSGEETYIQTLKNALCVYLKLNNMSLDLKTLYKSQKTLYIYNKMNNLRLNQIPKLWLGKKKMTGLVKMKK
jgi:hypothetical protein